MTVTQSLLSFTVAAGLVTIAPGLDTALVLRTVAVNGARRAMLAGAGICLGVLSWGVMVSVGLGELLHASPLLHLAIRIAGAAYLIFLGGQFLLKRDSIDDATNADSDDDPARPTEKARAWFFRGYLSNILNPKVGLFYVSFLPLFVPAGVSVAKFSMLLAAIHAMEGVVWITLLVLAARTLSVWLRRPRVARSINRATGIVFVGFGLRLLFERNE